MTARLLHLQAAACAVPAAATLDAQIGHLRLEAERGAYVAEALVAGALDRLRADLGDLLGAPAALVESCTSARTALLAAWPLPETGAVAMAPSEWGPNVEAFAGRGLAPVWLDVDADGVLDLDSLDHLLATSPPTLVHLTHVAAHRGLVQPVAEALALCRAARVPLWVDAAQALGHLDSSYGADAVYATGRKWLRGPRGVAVVAVAEQHHDALRLLRTSDLADLPVIRLLESGESNVAGRVGLARAVRDLVGAGPPSVHDALAAGGAVLRDAVGTLDGWEVVDAPEAGAIIGLRPRAGQDVVAVQRRLLEDHRILSTAGLPWRAPHEMTEPLLRLAPHLGVSEADAARLVAAL